MKVLIEEYGKILIYSALGILVLTVVVVGVRTWYQYTYPELEEVSVISAEVSSDEPVLLVDVIEIPMQESGVEIDFAEYAVAYSNSELTSELPVTVIGAELVDLQEKGMYEIVMQVTDSKGTSFTKNVSVLVY